METQSSLPKKGAEPHIFGPCLLFLAVLVWRGNMPALRFTICALAIIEFGLNILRNPVTLLTLFVLIIDCSMFTVTVTVTSMQHFMTVFWNADSVCVEISSSRSGQSHTECIIVAFLKPHFYRALRSKIADLVYQDVLSIQLGGLGSAVSSRSGSGRSPAAERYLLHFGLNKVSDESNFTCIFSKEYPQIWQVKWSTSVGELLTTISTDPLCVAPTRKQLVTDTTRC